MENNVSVSVYGGENVSWFDKSKLLWQSGVLAKFVNKPETCLYLMHAGMQMGLDPFLAAREFDMIEGKLSLSIKMQRALLAKAGVRWTEKELTAQKCIIEFKREGWPDHTETFDIEDARAAKMLTKQNYLTHPKPLMAANCFRRGASKIAADILLGLDGADDYEGSDPTAEVPPKDNTSAVPKTKQKTAPVAAVVEPVEKLPTPPEAIHEDAQYDEVKPEPGPAVVAPTASGVTPASDLPLEIFDNSNPEHRRILMAARTESGINIRQYNLNAPKIIQDLEVSNCPATKEALKLVMEKYK